jgi:hypothetical protein
VPILNREDTLIKRTPLNGTKTHPLSAHALGVLGWLLQGPMPRMRINPGVVDRFEREELAREVWLPSPFASHKGATCAHIEITEAGRQALARHAQTQGVMK